MSQRAEKYARNMERRVDKLEDQAGRLEESRDKIGRKLGEYGHRLAMIESDISRAAALHDDEVEVRRRGEVHAVQDSRRPRREIERAMDRQRAVPVIALGLAIVALILAAMAMDASREAREAAKAERAAVIFTVEQEPTATLLVGDAWEFAALYRAAADPAEKQRIGEALEAQGYFSAAVPLSWEYQDYMRTYCHLYGCPYPLALAVADWETRGQFNMEAVGPAGEVGIMQLNPGPGGSYHAELEAATGLDPTTPEGNIAGGCYKLGKYLAEYGDAAMVAMAYNRGQAGARAAWEAGITSNEYTDAVLEAMERWGCAVNAWAGE